LHSSFYMAESCFDACTRIRDLLTSRTSRFTKDTKVNEVDLLFGGEQQDLASADFENVFRWVLAVSAWEANIRAIDSHLQRLSNAAMSKPSLKTFRPIPILRQNVTDLKDALQREKDKISDVVRTHFSEFRKTKDYTLESLDSVFETLLNEADVLSAKVSNEIQLVIGSVTIMVIHL
jgi:hypothetical protein